MRLQRWIQDSLRRGCRPSSGCQHTVLPKFPKNCMKLKNILGYKGPLGHHPKFSIIDIKVISICKVYCCVLENITASMVNLQKLLCYILSESSLLKAHFNIPSPCPCPSLSKFNGNGPFDKQIVLELNQVLQKPSRYFGNYPY